MIDIQNLTFSYTGQSNLFEDFSLTIEKGMLWSIIGPSGCGKSTFLYFISRLISPKAGTIKVNGEISTRPRPQTGLVLQDHGLLPWSTAEENVRLGFNIRRFYGPDGLHAPSESTLGKEKEQKLVDEWMDRVGIADLKKKYPSQMSRGQRQRTALARTLALSPDLLLMDEPFSALDAPTRKDLQDLVIGLNKEQDLTCVTVTHNIDEAVFMGSKILVLQQKTNAVPDIIDNPSSANTRHQEFQAMCEKTSSLLELTV